MVKMVQEELADKNITLELTESAREYLAEKGFDPVLGARPLRRVIQNEVEDTLSDELLGGELREGDVALVDAIDGKIVITPKHQEPEDAEPGCGNCRRSGAGFGRGLGGQPSHRHSRASGESRRGRPTVIPAQAGIQRLLAEVAAA